MRSSTHFDSGRFSDRRRRHLIEDERGRFGAVADDRVTLVEDPRRKTGGRERPAVNRGVGQKTLQPPSGEKEHRPRRVLGGRRLKVRRHRVDFGVGRRRPIDRIVEASEALHQSPSGSPSQAVRMVAGVEADLREGDARVARRGRVWRGRGGARLGNGLEKGGPVGVVGEDEPSVERALPAHPSDPHQA